MGDKNVLLIVADDLGRNLGCYGEKVVQTPHIDNLASQGIKFDNAFASTASCSGSRSVIYTGLHTHQNGQYGLQHTFHHFMTHDYIETLPKLFNDAGYVTGIINKVHVGPDAVYPWTIRHESPTRDVSWVAGKAAQVFANARAEKKSFCLTIGYMDPHRDNTRGGFANGAAYPKVTDIQYDPAEVQVPFYLPDLPAVRTEMAEYYRSISRMDQGVGMVLQNLRDAGLFENTLIMFVSDNGAPFLNSKTTLYDAGVRLPMILKVPGGPAGVVNDAFVSYIDIVPTFLDFAGYHPPSNKAAPRMGRSILSLLEAGQRAEWPEVFGSHTFHELTNYYPTRFLRNERWKYHRNVCWQLDFPFSADIYASKSWEAIRNHPTTMKDGKKEIIIGKRTLAAYIRRGPEELYDMLADPHEVRNLAGSPEAHETLLSMRAKVIAWQKETDDPWLFRDGVSMRSMAQYIGEDGWSIQDRFDFELENPGSG